jgi:hypothetical protein
MTHRIAELAGVRVLVCDAEGPVVTGEREATDLIGDAFSAGAKLVVIPLARLPEGFLDLKTRLAGAVLQKFVNYERRVALLGDVTEACARSEPLAAFVRESNRGRTVWFVQDLAELEAKLTP